MFTPGGQIDHLTFAGLRKGKGGGSDNSALYSYLLNQQTSSPTTYTDPNTGLVYTDLGSYNTALSNESSAAAAKSALATQQATDTATQNENTFQSARQNEYNNALQSVMQTFQGQGVDPTQYMGYITPQLQSAYNSIPDLTSADKISSYFPTSLGQTILNQATSDRRTQAANAANQIFTPTYAQTQLPSTIMNQPISDMLSSQFDPLSAQLQNALNRGTLNQAGYNAALDRMAQNRSTAQSQLQSLGQNILTSDQSALTGVGTSAQQAAANLGLGQTFDPSVYAAQGSQLAAQDISGFSGALQNAAGNVSYGNIQDLLNAGGAVQGATNPQGASPAGAVAGGTGTIGGGGGGAGTQQDQTGQDQTQRGLGTTGAF